MSKRRSVILSVVLEGRSQAETARLYDVSQASVSRWVARWRAEGDTAFEPRSRRSKTSPTRLSDVVIEQLVRPRLPGTRFVADLPNEMWQTDMTHVRLANGTDVEVLTFLDDHSRFAVSVIVHARVTTPVVIAQFRETAGQHGYQGRHLELDPNRDYQPKP